MVLEEINFAKCANFPFIAGVNLRCFSVRFLIGTQTLDSTPKDSRKGCPYGSKGEIDSEHHLDIVGEPLAGSLAPTFISRPFVDRNINV